MIELMAHEPSPEWMDLKALSRHASLSVRTLRSLLRDPRHPLPHYRLGALPLSVRNGRPVRGAKVLVRRSEFNAWMTAWRVEQQRGSDLDSIVAEAMARAGTPKMGGRGGQKTRARDPEAARK